MYMKVVMSEETVPKRQYTEEFRTEAVRLAESVGGHEAARRLGIPSATLNNWSRRRRKAPGKETIESAPSGHARRSPTDLEAENSRLRKELASARLDVEILRKATAYFAKGSR
jgi:transposase